MFNIDDIKLIASGMAGNLVLYLSNWSQMEIAVKVMGHIAVTFATIYYMYRNHKKKR